MKRIIFVLSLVVFSFSYGKSKRKVASTGQVPDCVKEAKDQDSVHMGYLISYNLNGKSANDVAKFLDLANGERLYPRFVVPIPRFSGKYNELHADIPVVAHETVKADFLKSLKILSQLDGVAIGCDIEGKE